MARVGKTNRSGRATKGRSRSSTQGTGTSRRKKRKPSAYQKSMKDLRMAMDDYCNGGSINGVVNAAKDAATLRCARKARPKKRTKRR